MSAKESKQVGLNTAPKAGAKVVACPRCKKQNLFTSENPYRPFCSLRCKEIDLGSWIQGTYVIPGETLIESSSNEGSVEEEGLQRLGERESSEPT